ncbi:MAG: hypothetical protein ACMUJJ_01240 [Roseicyclus sp.]|jgi:hypothetical protein|uniref:hypothetical protein n=1 Tax=Roseicyclus sp. TaxID=1914329 RepID=UPI003A860C5A
MLKRLGLALGVVLALGAGGVVLVRMMDTGATAFRVEGSVLHMSGPVSGAAADRLDRLLEENTGLTVLALGDIPGADDVNWVTGMGRLIRSAGLETRVEGQVVNDAIFLFLGGATRSMAGGALVLQSDAAQRQAGVAVDQSTAAEGDRLRYVEAVLGAPDFADFMSETRASGAQYILTEADIARFGLTRN